MKPAPWVLKNNTLILSCHIQPGARHNRLVGLHDQRLKIQLKAPPVDGKANEMLIEYLAKLCARPRAEISISRGESSRHKTIQINGISQIPEEFFKLSQE